MAVPATSNIPWREILKTVPTVIVAAKEFWDKWNSRKHIPVVDPQSEVKTQITAIVKRIQSLEDSEVDQASLIKQITEQLQGLSTGLDEVANRASIGIWLSAGAFGIACIALLLAILQ